MTNNASADTITLNLYYKPTQLTVSKIVKGYTLDANKAFTFTIQAQAPSEQTQVDPQSKPDRSTSRNQMV